MSDQIRFETLVIELNYIEAEIKGKLYLQELPPLVKGICWGGAGVVITNRKIKEVNFFNLISKNAKEISWYFYRIRDTAYENNVIHYNSKFVFYKNLAAHIKDYEKNTSNRAEDTLLELLAETRRIAINWDNL